MLISERPDLKFIELRNLMELYQQQTKIRKRILSALREADGELDFERLQKQTLVTPGDLAHLQKLGVAFALPSLEKPERVVMPLEVVFALPIPPGPPDSLSEGLRLYPKSVLWSIASEMGIAADGADEYTLRARIYLRAKGATVDGLGGPARKLLSEFRPGCEIDVSRISFQCGRSPFETIEGLFAGPKDALSELLHRVLVIPIRSGPGSPYWQRLGVPREFRAFVPAEAPPAPRPTAAPNCRAGQSPALHSREGRVRGELLRFLLMLENDPPAVTQKGAVNRRDLARIAKRSGMSEARIEELNNLAVRLRLLLVRAERIVLSSEASVWFAGDFDRKAADWFRDNCATPGAFWIDDAAARKASGAALAGLIRTRSTPDELVCLHCFGAALVPIVKQNFHYLPDGAEKMSVEYGVQFARTLHEFGFAAVEQEGRAVRSFRWTKTGLSAWDDRTAPAPAAPSFVVQPTGEIIAPLDVPFDELRLLARAADVRSADAVAVFSLSRASLLRAAQRGEDLERVRKTLVDRSSSPLPQTISFLLDELTAKQGEIEIVPCAALVRVRDPLVLKMLGDEVRIVGDGLAILAADRKPNDLMASLRKKGYLPRFERAPEPTADRGGIVERLQEAADSAETVEVELRGGRRQTVCVTAVTQDTLEAFDERTERDVDFDLASIVSVRVVRDE